MIEGAEVTDRASAPTRPRRVDVLGVGVSVTSMEATLAQISVWIEQGERSYVCVTNVHTIMECQDDPELLRIHNESGLTVPDGAPILWAGRAAGAREMGRVRGPDLLPAACELAAHHRWRAFFYGGSPGTAERLATRLAERFPELLVAGTYAPPFRDLTPEEDAAVVERINSSGADLVWVGLSAPKQERWMAAHRERLRSPVLIGVGAAFDIHAGLKPQAPAWMRPLGLEWLFRLALEPRRLWSRYLRTNPRFVAGILRRRPYLRDG
jgi:N-acetylglucosaminyldiphosphoundecaprenol N-acetyl-beta-D-mannosaminyltransferase